MAVGSGSVADAARPAISTVPVNDLGANVPPPASATSTIVRTDGGVTVSVNTNIGGDGTATMWWLVWNEPGACFGLVGVPFRCVPPPAGGPDIPDCVLFATGVVVGNSGNLNYTGHRSVGDSSNGLFPCDGITEPRDADIHAIVRLHGQTIPGQVDDQIHTFTGACGPGPAFALCSDVQGAVHEP